MRKYFETKDLIKRLGMKKILNTNLIEICGLILLIGLAFGIRLWNLNTIPGVINGDEAGSVLHPLQILMGLNRSLFELTHDGNISYLIYYPRAILINIFGYGQTLLAVRLVTVIFSLGVILLFYLIAKRYVSKLSAMITTMMLASSYWLLNFSRLSWICIESVFWGLLGMLVLEKIKKTNEIKFYLIEGILCGIILYNYMGGRIYFVAICIYLLAKIFRSKRNGNVAKFIIFTLAVFITFSPQIIEIGKNYTTYIRRPQSLFVLSVTSEYYGIDPKNKLSIIGHQIAYGIKGLLFFDSRVSGEGIENQRYVPTSNGAVNKVIFWLFFMGVVVAIIKKKDIGLWLILYLLNIVMFQIPSVMIPSWSRSIGIIPIIYLFAAIGFEELYKILTKNSVIFGTIIVVFIGIQVIFSDVKTYFSWVRSDAFLSAQQPSITIREFPEWLDKEIEWMKNGKTPFTFYDWYEMKNSSKSNF